MYIFSLETITTPALAPSQPA